jgi:hypothetical protein
MNNPAFEYLRQFKKVSDETEELVIKFVKKKYPEISVNELVTIFENGIAGEFGKIYSADPETILEWIRKHTIKKGSERSYYETPLLTKDVSIYDSRYPQRTEDWLKEVNKAFTAYLNGVSVYEMHEHIYDRLMVDSKIEMNSYLNYFTENVQQAKQRYLKDYFENCKMKGLNQIYFIKKTNE